MLIFFDLVIIIFGIRDNFFIIYFVNNVEFSIKVNLEVGILQFFIYIMVVFDLRMSYDFNFKLFW